VLCDGATVYGVYTKETGSGTTYTRYTGIINPANGNISPIMKNYVLYDSQVYSIGGNTAFDQKNKILYYTDNTHTDFVYSINVVNKTFLELYSANSGDVFGVAFDSANEYLAIAGTYGDSQAIVFIPTANDSLKSKQFNFTKQIGGTPFAGGTIDPKNSIYYTIYFDDNGALLLAVIDIATLKAKSVGIDCQGYFPFGLTYDAVQIRLISIGTLVGEINYIAYLEIDPQSYACTVTPLNLSDPILISAYDPINQTVYMLANGQIQTYNIPTNKLSNAATLQYDVVSLSVSYP